MTAATPSDHVCERCGAHEHGRWIPDTAKRLAETRRCFHCDYWEELERRVNDPACVRADGVHYVIGDERRRSGDSDICRGFAGRAFRIAFHDGRVVDTTNLWFQGDIPEQFRPTMPDNATFVQEGGAQ